jgi:hypothetical protein
MGIQQGMEESGSLLIDVSRFLRLSGMGVSTLGHEAVGDRCLVRDLRNGRQPTERTVQRIRGFMRLWCTETERELLDVS